MALETSDIIKLGLVAAGGYVTSIKEVQNELKKIPGGKMGEGIAPLLGAFVLKYISDSEWAEYIAYFLAGMSAGAFGDPDFPAQQAQPSAAVRMFTLPLVPEVIK